MSWVSLNILYNASFSLIYFNTYFFSDFLFSKSKVKVNHGNKVQIVGDFKAFIPITVVAKLFVVNALAVQL